MHIRKCGYVFSAKINKFAKTKPMKLIVFLTIILSIFNKGCFNNSKDDTKETPFEREQRLVNEYEKQVVISKGKDTYYIPKGEISWYFNADSFYSIHEAKIKDNISFFDTLGNIIYQAIIVDFKEGKPIIKCQDLKTAEYYTTVLNIDSIRDLERKYPYEIKSYRHK